MVNSKMEKFFKSKSGEILVGTTYAIMQMIVVGIISLGMVLGARSGNQNISQANYASFVQRFGEFRDEVKIQAASVLAEAGNNGKALNNAQRYYMAANGFSVLDYDDSEGIYEMSLPVGYIIPEDIQDALGLPQENKETNNIVAYLITDKDINGYESQEERRFYTDESEEEYHLVTSNGIIFTIPGYSQKEDDGSMRYYITSEGHYLSTEITKKAFTKLYGKDLYGNIVTISPIYDSKFKKNG